MALPKLAVPTFSIKLPSSGNVVEFRPFLVKEEKMLLIAAETQDNAEMINAMMKIIEACVITEGFAVKKLPFFDAEYLFLQLRGKSVGEKMKLFYRHAQAVNREGTPCDVSTEVELDLEKIQVDMSTAIPGKIMLNDKFGVELRYPSMEDVLPKNLTEEPDEMELVAKCLVHAFDNEEIYESDTLDEAKKFIESLSSAQFAKITEFFEAAPDLTHTFTYKCTGCGQEDTVTLKGIADFF
jgi:T4 bacteriophage base plate protein